MADLKAAWWKPPYRFPDEPTLENVTTELFKGITWHAECPERCAYGTMPMISDTCRWIATTDLTAAEISGLCVLLQRLYHEALGKWS